MFRLAVLLFLLGQVLIFISCKNNIDTSDPRINFISPAENYIVNIPDTIDIEVGISDDRVIKTVAVSVVDENKIPIVQAKYYTPNTNQFFFQTSFELIDKSLVSGPCQILVTAFDGENSKNKYRTIILNEIPARIEAYIALSGQFNFKTTILRLDHFYEIDTQFIFPHRYSLSAIHGLWEEFFFITDEPAYLYSFNPFDFEIEWNIGADPPRAQYTAVISDQELIFSTANGDVAICGEDGNITLRTVPYDSKTINCLAADDKYIYAGHTSLSGNIHELTVFYRVTGEIKVQRLMGGEVMSLATYNDDVLVFIRSEPGSEVMQYDPEELILTKLTILPVEEINEVVRITDDEFLLVTDINVIAYQPANNGLSVFSEQAHTACRYDPLNDIVYLLSEFRVSGYDWVSENLVMEKIFPERVLDFQILYNK